MLDNASDKKSETLDIEAIPGEIADNDIPNEAVVRTYSDPPRFVPPTHGGVDILKLLTELEDMVENTPHGPFNTLFRFDEDKFHMTIMKIRANLPEEMKRASKLARETERIVEEARENAERVAKDAKNAALSEFERGKGEAQQLRDAALSERDRLRQMAEEDARRIREEAHKAGEVLIEEARSQAAQLVADSEIIRQAQARAQDMQARIEQEAAAMRFGAEEYARDVLTHLESVLGKAASQVQHGKEMLKRDQ